MADPDLRRAVINGAAAAILGAGAWALSVELTKHELSHVAWGVGVLVGYTMTRATARRGRSTALIAAALAAMGLLAGKAFIAERVVRRHIADTIRADSLALAQFAAWELSRTAAFPAPLQARLDAIAPDDTLPHALWEEMLVAGSAHLATLAPAQRDSFARLWTPPYPDYRFLHVLRWQFSPRDVLWFSLAIATAWRMLAGPLRIHRETT